MYAPRPFSSLLCQVSLRLNGRVELRIASQSKLYRVTAQHFISTQNADSSSSLIHEENKPKFWVEYCWVTPYSPKRQASDRKAPHAPRFHSGKFVTHSDLGHILSSFYETMISPSRRDLTVLRYDLSCCCCPDPILHCTETELTKQAIIKPTGKPFRMMCDIPSDGKTGFKKLTMKA